MFKLITFGILAYLFYRFFIRPALPFPSSRPPSSPRENQEEDNGEYIDYEEVD